MESPLVPAGFFPVRLARLCVVWCLSLISWGCAVAPLTQKEAHPATPSVLGKPAETRLGQELMRQTTAHLGLSGFYLLSGGMDAFLARALMIDAAERSIDLQYFIIDDDTTTQLLLSRLLRAADRGVRVRMLIDDTNAHDVGLSRLTAHPGIQVRTFNPMRSRYFGSLSVYFNLLVNGRELNRRMHNKLLAVDGAAAIVGGRNLSDAYYEARPGLIFMDLDLWAVGPIVPALDRQFEEYWQSPWATPLSYFKLLPPSVRDVEKIRKRLAAREREAQQSQYAVALQDADLLQRLERGQLDLIWARAELAYDSPHKINGTTTSRHVGPRIRELAEQAEREVIFVSPYFIPQRDGLKLIGDLRQRGVQVLVLTNSLRATDMLPASVAFCRYRPKLLRQGVDLYELKPTAAFEQSMGRSLFGSKSMASLHAKSYIFDRQTVLIGSFNFDPRSQHLNTEMGLIVHSPELAEQVLALVRESCKLANSYHVTLDPPPGGGAPRPVWHTEGPQGQESRLAREPGKTLKFYLTRALLRLFPLEGML